MFDLATKEWNTLYVKRLIRHGVPRKIAREAVKGVNRDEKDINPRESADTEYQYWLNGG